MKRDRPPIKSIRIISFLILGISAFFSSWTTWGDIKQCVLDHLRSQLPASGFTEVVRLETGLKPRTEIGTNRITPANIEAIFAHEYEQNRFGAKAVGYTDQSGNWNLVFWRTGQGRSATNVHHRDVLAGYLKKEANRLQKKNPEAEERWLDLEIASDELYNVRKVDSFETLPKGILENSQGFQLTAERINGKMKITRFDVDSSITSAQLHHGVKFSANDMAKTIAHVYAAIDPAVMAAKTIRITGLEHLGFTRDELLLQLRNLGIRVNVTELTSTTKNLLPTPRPTAQPTTAKTTKPVKPGNLGKKRKK